MEQKSQKGIIIGALVVVVALGLIFFYAGQNQEPSASTPVNNEQPAAVTPDDAPEKLSKDAEQGLPDIEADLKEVDDALKTL